MDYDVWFARFDDILWAVTANPGDHPLHVPRMVPDVASALRPLRSKGHNIVQVGIVPAEMLGLE